MIPQGKNRRRKCPTLQVIPTPKAAWQLLDDALQALRQRFSGTTWRLEVVSTPEAAREQLQTGSFPVVIFDADARESETLELLEEPLGPVSPLLTVVLTRYPERVGWPDVLNRNGYDFVTSPFDAGGVRWVLYHAWDSGDEHRVSVRREIGQSQDVGALRQRAANF